MELYQLRSFVAVAELGHLTRAADRLHISQPALSAQIRALEDELQLELFERKHSGMALTPAGRRLAVEANKLLSAAQALRNEARAIKGEVSGVARLGTVSDPGFIRVSDFLALAIERYPLLEIQLQHVVSGEAFEQVREGVLDASFYYGEASHPDVAAADLREITYRIVAPAAWAQRTEGAAWPELAALPWILTPSISTHNQLATRLFAEHGMSPSKVVEADDEVVISSLVVAGLGVALMREDLAQAKAAAGEVALRSDVKLSTTLRFVYRRAREQDPVIRSLVDVVHDVWALQLRPPRQRRRAPPRGAPAPVRS